MHWNKTRYSGGRTATRTWIQWTILEQWRCRKVHVLGGMPDSQHAVIDLLTQPTIDQQSPANIVGLDGNGCFKVALYDEYWAPTRHEPADHLSIRDTVKQSLLEIKEYWQDVGVWPDTEPVDLYGSAVGRPDKHIFMDRGGDPIPTRDALEAAYVEEYEDYGTLAFNTEIQKKFIEYREGLTQRG